MSLDIKKFTADYLEALREADAVKLVELVTTIKTDDERAEALASIIEAIQEDKDLIEKSPKLLDVLSQIKEGIADCTPKEKTKEAVVEAPSLHPVEPKVEAKADEA